MSSKYLGVSWHKATKKWRAQIVHESKILQLGTYETEEEAARAFDVEAIGLRGPSTRVNFQGSTPTR